MRASDDEGEHEGGRRLVGDVDDDEVRAARGVDVLHRVAGGDAHRGADDGHRVDQGLAHRGLGGGVTPAVVAPDPPVEGPAAVKGVDPAVVVDEHLAGRPDGTDRGAGHRMPCNSGFASRTMRVGTMSAGRRPS